MVSAAAVRSTRAAAWWSPLAMATASVGAVGKAGGSASSGDTVLLSWMDEVPVAGARAARVEAGEGDPGETVALGDLAGGVAWDDGVVGGRRRVRWVDVVEGVDGPLAHPGD